MAWIFILVGSIIVLVGLFFHKKFKELEASCTAMTNGKVVKIEEREESYIDTDSDGDQFRRKSVMYYPTFQYAVGDKTIEKKGSTGNSSPKFTQDQAVTVFYNPASPESFYVLEDKDGSRFGIYLMIFGAVIIVIGIIVPFFPS